jgi:hypothetical protein
MTNVTDSELTTIQNAVVTTRQALEPDDSPQAQELKKMLIECEQILSGKLTGSGGDPMANSAPIGASADDAVTKTKDLFEMFQLT